jgi:hypothetical protein
MSEQITLRFGFDVYSDLNWDHEREKLTFTRTERHARIGEYHVAVSYKTLARWIKRNVAEIYGFELLPDEVQERINDLCEQVKPMARGL